MNNLVLSKNRNHPMSNQNRSSIALLFFILTLASCGGGSSDNSSAGDQETLEAPETPETPEALEVKSLPVEVALFSTGAES
jgi:hypothetical protein